MACGRALSSGTPRWAPRRQRGSVARPASAARALVADAPVGLAPNTSERLRKSSIWWHRQPLRPRRSGIAGLGSQADLRACCAPGSASRALTGALAPAHSHEPPPAPFRARRVLGHDPNSGTSSPANGGRSALIGIRDRVRGGSTASARWSPDRRELFDRRRSLGAALRAEASSAGASSAAGSGARADSGGAGGGGGAVASVNPEILEFVRRAARLPGARDLRADLGPMNASNAASSSAS